MLENISVTLSKPELEKLITEYIRKELRREVASVTFDMTTQSTGYGAMERDEKVFTGVTVKTKPIRTEY